MNRYHNPIPRAAFAIAAFTLTALTLSVSIVAPAKMDFTAQAGDALAARQAVAPSATEVVDVGRIGVIAVREPALVPVLAHGVPARHKQQS